MKILTQTETNTEELAQKRRHERRACDQCVAEIKGKSYPVVNWSQGGTLLAADDRLFGTDEAMDVTMKFHLEDRIIPVTNAGKVLRKQGGRVAVQFDPLAEDSRRHFQQIIDDITTREFADSQA